MYQAFERSDFTPADLLLNEIAVAMGADLDYVKNIISAMIQASLLQIRPADDTGKSLPFQS
jgi:hypothetical protein